MKTTKDILIQAQKLFPLDLVKRIKWLNLKADTCDIDDLGAHMDAIRITRNGKNV